MVPGAGVEVATATRAADGGAGDLSADFASAFGVNCDVLGCADHRYRPTDAAIRNTRTASVGSDLRDMDKTDSRAGGWVDSSMQLWFRVAGVHLKVVELDNGMRTLTFSLRHPLRLHNIRI